MNDWREIPLTQGQVAVVDAADYEWLNQWKWYASWCKRMRGYYAKRDAYRHEKVWMHRLILGLEIGDKLVADHQNNNTLDNRRSNLRIATSAQNCANSRIKRNNRSGFKGVYFKTDRAKWAAVICVGGRRKFLGCFTTPELAHAAYCNAAKTLCGEFARTA